MIVQTIALATSILLTVLVARLVGAWIRRRPETRPDDVEQTVLLGIERLSNRPLEERERLLDEIRHRLAV